MREKTGLPLNSCRAALKKHKGNVDAAIAALIDSGLLTQKDLNTDLVSDALFARASKQQMAGMFETMVKKTKKGPMGDVLSELLKFGQEAMKEFDEQPNVGSSTKLYEKISRRSDKLKKKPVKLKKPPFPELTLGIHDWTGVDTFKTWAGFQARQGGYASRSSSKPSKGTVPITVPRAQGDEDDAKPKPIAPEHVAAYKHLKEHEREVTDAILAGILKYYVELKKMWEADDKHMPPLSKPAELKNHIGLGSLIVLNQAKDGHAYIGMEIGCTWDEEHACGVCIHKARVVDVGQADAAGGAENFLNEGAIDLRTGKPIGSGKAIKWD
jgi:hypothetical protein